MNFDINIIVAIASIVVAFFAVISISITIFKTIFSKKDKQTITKLTEEMGSLESEVMAEDEKVSALTSENKALKGLNELFSVIIPEAIELAENSGINTGMAKLAFALSKIALYCTENGFNYNELKDDIKAKVEDLIDFSKNVNKRQGEIEALPVSEAEGVING